MRMSRQTRPYHRHAREEGQSRENEAVASCDMLGRERRTYTHMNTHAESVDENGKQREAGRGPGRDEGGGVGGRGRAPGRRAKALGARTCACRGTERMGT